MVCAWAFAASKMTALLGSITRKAGAKPGEVAKMSTLIFCGVVTVTENRLVLLALVRLLVWFSPIGIEGGVAWALTIRAPMRRRQINGPTTNQSERRGLVFIGLLLILHNSLFYVAADIAKGVV